MRPVHVACIAVVLLGLSAGATLADDPAHRKLTAVPFTEVKLQDAFWAPRLETNREKSLPHNFKWCEQTGRFSNFAKAGGLVEGKFEGIYFNDSDVYKVLEGASYSLADHPDPKLDKMVDEVVAKMAAAQRADGYLNTYFTLVEPDKRWTNCAVRHELYCAGHLFEAAVAHHRATGKRSLLDVATKFADHIDSVFGPQRRHDVPGHEEIELALVKLYQLTSEERYLKLAEFFLDIRGDESKREKIYGPYCQDHKPICQQEEIGGHAVRAMYLYCGVADVAAFSGHEGFVETMDRLWKDVTQYKMYVTGGIGARHAGEAFGDRYELPNASAYCETCAAIGLGLWAHRMNLLHGDAHYADVLERVIYNGFLSGVSLDGEKYFYVNPLDSGGGHHRQPFYGCACCPTNVVRFLPSVPGYVYATGQESIYVNLFVAGKGQVGVAGTKVAIEQKTRYPWDGRVELVLTPEKPAEFAVNIRVPQWCEGDEPSITYPGSESGSPEKVHGYACIRRTWKAGDRIVVELPMRIKRIEAHPRVEADRGRVAIQRGPVVYCFEAVDNGGRARNIMLPADPKLTAEHREDLLGGVTVINGVDRKGDEIMAIPYYAWDHREPGEMVVWVRQLGKTRSPATEDESWAGRLYRPLDPATLGPPEPLTLMEIAQASGSHRYGRDALSALNDGSEPKNSCDHGIPRFTWWDHRGTQEWVQYDFEEPRKVSSVSVYWFDDERQKRHCRTPQSWKLLYRSGKQWKPVAAKGPFGTAADKFNRVDFDAVETEALRVEVQLKPTWSGGVLEWKVE